MAQHLTDRLDRAVMEAAQRSPVGYFCQYVPPELIEAAGRFPVRLGGRGCGAAESRGESYLHSDCCSFCKEALGLRAAGDPLYASLAAVIVPSTCDMMRRHGEVWEDGLGVPVYALNVPTTSDEGTTLAHFRRELAGLSEWLCGLSGASGRPLADAIRGWSRVRAVLRELRPRLSARAMHLAVHLSFVGPSAEVLSGLEDLAPDGPGDPRIRLMVAGGPIASLDLRLFDIVDALPDTGIVANATCTGERWMEIAEPTEMSLDALAAAYLGRAPCAWRRPNAELYGYLRRLITERGVDGVLVRTLPFCDVWRAEVQRMRDELGVPLLHIDTSYAASSVEQLRTRVTAFAESLAAGARAASPGRRFVVAVRAACVAARGARSPAPPALEEPPDRAFGHVDPPPGMVSVDDWDALFARLPAEVPLAYRYLRDRPEFSTPYMMPLSEFVRAGDARLASLRYDNSLAALRVWCFLETEETRLFDAHAAGKKIFGVMKDLGTIPVLAYSSDNAVAFYPEGAWWLPCIKQMHGGLLRRAARMGFGDEMCPARAMLGALEIGAHWPIPDLFIGGVGACCDDMSAIMQQAETMGADVLWWELPMRSDRIEAQSVELPNGEPCPTRLVDLTVAQIERVRAGMEDVLGERLTDDRVAEGIRAANRVREVLAEVRDLAYGVDPAPAPALETLICEMFAIHFCSDRDESLRVLEHFRDTLRSRAERGEGVLPADACRVTWVNPVADLRMVNLVEELGGRVAGSEFLFTHAMTLLREDVDPLTSLAFGVLQDPMIGSARYRAQRVIEQVDRYGAEGVLITRIPGASHCSSEGLLIASHIRRQRDLPVLEVEVPPLIDAHEAQLRTRLEAFFETIRARRHA